LNGASCLDGSPPGYYYHVDEKEKYFWYIFWINQR